MSSNDSAFIECAVVVEWLNSNQVITRNVSYKKGNLHLKRNGLKEIFLEISEKTSASLRFQLKSFVVHKKFMHEGKAAIDFQNENVRVMIKNSPPSHLIGFLKTMYIKVSKETAQKVSLKERFLNTNSAIEEISPLTSKEEQEARAKLAIKKQLNVTPKSATRAVIKKRSLTQQTSNGEEKPIKRRCISQSISLPITPEQDRVLKAVLSGQSVFFTGSAGTGKSFLLRRIISALPPESTVATASTGVAACHIGGYTIHSFAGIGPGTASLKRSVELARRPHIAQQWRRCKVLIIDEISMIDGRFFEKLEYVAREIKSSDRPFGGIQLVLCGDFFQLPPVSKTENGTESQAIFCFQSQAWGNCNLSSYELNTVHRQSDSEFIDILQSIRIGRVTPQIVKRLQATQSHAIEKDGILASRLCSLTKESQLINSSKLEELADPMKVFTAVDSDPYSSENLNSQTPAEAILNLKIGAQVMLLKNLNLSEKLVNGARGVVVKFSPEGLPVVRFRTGEYTIRPEKWSIRLKGGNIITRKQIPLKLAWAFSIHKSQGLTLDCVEMCLTGVFEAGQAYVALSRAKSLDSLRVLNFEAKQVWANPTVLKYYQKLRRNMAAFELIPLGKKSR